MPERLTFILLLSLTISFVLCTSPGAEDDEEEDYDQEFRGFNEYETWKPASQPAAPEVILIKQKDPHHHHDTMHSIGSLLKHNLPLLAVLAPLVAMTVLLPLKAYLGPSYVVYPPVTTSSPSSPSSMRGRGGKMDNEVFEEHRSLAEQLLNMIEEFEKAYEDMTTDDESS